MLNYLSLSSVEGEGPLLREGGGRTMGRGVIGCREKKVWNKSFEEWLSISDDH